MGVQLDVPELLAEHAQVAAQALIAGDRELEIVQSRQAQMTASVALQAQAAQGDILVEQLDIQFRAVLAGQAQGALANAVAAPCARNWKPATRQLPTSIEARR